MSGVKVINKVKVIPWWKCKCLIFYQQAGGGPSTERHSCFDEFLVCKISWNKAFLTGFFFQEIKTTFPLLYTVQWLTLFSGNKDGSLLSPCFLETKLKMKSAVGLCTILLILIMQLNYIHYDILVILKIVVILIYYFLHNIWRTELCLASKWGEVL